MPASAASSAGLWFAPRGERAWRWLFVLGPMLGAAAWVGFGPQPLPREAFPKALLVLAGLLVGYGTSMCGGCTGGHGVCGLARMSRRSLVATAVFMGAGVATTFVARHLLGVA